MRDKWHAEFNVEAAQHVDSLEKYDEATDKLRQVEAERDREKSVRQAAEARYVELQQLLDAAQARERESVALLEADDHGDACSDVFEEKGDQPCQWPAPCWEHRRRRFLASRSAPLPPQPTPKVRSGLGYLVCSVCHQETCRCVAPPPQPGEGSATKCRLTDAPCYAPGECAKADACLGGRGSFARPSTPEPPHLWHPESGVGWKCGYCLTEKRVQGDGELSTAFEYRKRGMRAWRGAEPRCIGAPEPIPGTQQTKETTPR